MSAVVSSAVQLLRESLSPSASADLPGDPGYSNKRWALNAEKNAALVVCPATAEDVAQALAFAQGKAPYNSQSRLPVSVKCGGHSPSGASSSEGGVVIDLQPNMHNVRVDPQAKLAYVGGGSLWGDVDDATTKHGLASVSGIVSHTGVGGLTLGGGFGWLCGQHGLVIDNMVEATVVTSSGNALKVSESENSDLFWAIRGGGGNFGVVTEFVLKLHEQRGDLYASTLIFPPDALEKVTEEVNGWLREREPTENGHFMFGVGPTGQPGIILKLLYNGDSETGSKKFERFIQLGPIINQTKTIPYIELNRLMNPVSEHGIHRLLHGNFVPDLPSGIPFALANEMYSSWLKLVTNYPAAGRTVCGFELYYNGKWSSVPETATAFVHRKPAYNIVYLASWSDPSFTPHASSEVFELDHAFIQARNAHYPRELVTQGGYVNYFDEESRLAATSKDKSFANKRFGSNYPRLMEIKRKYDTGNVFGRWFVEPEADGESRVPIGGDQSRLVH